MRPIGHVDAFAFSPFQRGLWGWLGRWASFVALGCVLESSRNGRPLPIALVAIAFRSAVPWPRTGLVRRFPLRHRLWILHVSSARRCGCQVSLIFQAWFLVFFRFVERLRLLLMSFRGWVRGVACERRIFVRRV